MKAVSSDLYDIAKLLLNTGADPNINNGQALLNAVIGKNRELVELLLENNADPNINNGEALISAVMNENRDLVKLLLENKADPNINNGEALLNAVISKNRELVELLLAGGADPNISHKTATNDVGVTDHIPSLIYLARYTNFSNDEIFRLLVASGRADLSVTYNRENIFSYYQSHNTPVMFEYLIAHGADHNLISEQDNHLLADIRGSQSAHNLNIINKVYSKLFTSEVIAELTSKKEELTKGFIDRIKTTDFCSDGSFKNFLLELIRNKFSDYQNPEINQGEQFIKDLLTYSKSTTRIEDIKQGTIKFGAGIESFFKNFLNSNDSKEYINHLAKNACELIESLSNSGEVHFDDQNTEQSININPGLMVPFAATDSKCNFNSLFIELIDASSMYNSGGGSCIKGQLNKISTVISAGHGLHLNDQENSQPFDYSGFKTNYDVLVEERILPELTPNRTSDLTNIEAQKVRAATYRALKGDGQQEGFAEMVYYSGVTEGENVFLNPENIALFKRKLPHKELFDIQDKILVSKEGKYSICEEFLPRDAGIATNEPIEKITYASIFDKIDTIYGKDNKEAGILLNRIHNKELGQETLLKLQNLARQEDAQNFQGILMEITDDQSARGSSWIFDKIRNKIQDLFGDKSDQEYKLLQKYNNSDKDTQEEILSSLGKATYNNNLFKQLFSNFCPTEESHNDLALLGADSGDIVDT